MIRGHTTFRLCAPTLRVFLRYGLRLSLFQPCCRVDQKDGFEVRHYLRLGRYRIKDIWSLLFSHSLNNYYHFTFSDFCLLVSPTRTKYRSKYLVLYKCMNFFRYFYYYENRSDGEKIVW
jgi:hypothetical protein